MYFNIRTQIFSYMMNHNNMSKLRWQSISLVFKIKSTIISQEIFLIVYEQVYDLFGPSSGRKFPFCPNDLTNFVIEMNKT